jgi:hypothetical protein
MAPQSPRTSLSVKSGRRRPPAKSVQLRCERFEDKIVPALFNVQTPLSITGLTNAGCVVSADLNHDGFVDAILTNFGTGFGSPTDTGTPGSTISILYGKAGGGFNRVTINSGGTNPSFVDIADLNGDGWPDAVVTNENRQGPGTFTVFVNDGAGNLSPAGTFQTGTTNPDCVRIADMTGDGVPDVVISSFGAQTPDGQSVGGASVTVYQQNTGANGKGNLTFSSAPIATLAPAVQFIPTAIAVADFNGDGINDIAAAVPGVPPDFGQPPPNGDIYVFQGTGSGGFSSNVAQYDSGGVGPVNIQAADVNGDGKKDLIVANPGDGTALTSQPDGQPLWAQSSVGVILNTSTATSVTFGFTNSLVANCYGTFAVAVADFNMDGKADIASINYGNPLGSPFAFVSVYQGTGTGTFNPPTPGTYDTMNGEAGGQYLAVGDFNGDGTPDLVVAHADSKVGLLLNATPTSSQPTVQSVGVDNGMAQRSMVRSLTVTFSGLVSFVGQQSAAFQLRQNGQTTNIAVNVDLTGSTATQTIAKLTFSGAFTEGSATNPTLVDGNYTLTVLSSQITGGLNGGDNVTSFFRLYGDINGDRTVNGLDLALFRSAFGTSLGNANYVDYLDFNGDGAINGLDLAAFRTRFGTSLVP